jgi:Xaa-Pro aminopeptidase
VARDIRIHDGTLQSADLRRLIPMAILDPFLYGEHEGRAVVPRRFPLIVADRLRAGGVELSVDGKLFDDRRRAKGPAELDGFRRAARAAEAGMATAARTVKAEVRAAYDAHDAEATEIMVAPGAQGASGHDMGSGPLVAGDVVTVEPGVYREGYGGVRLEDLFLVTDDGWERLTHHPMGLSPA